MHQDSLEPQLALRLENEEEMKLEVFVVFVVDGFVL
jgi:hypothetical protein